MPFVTTKSPYQSDFFFVNAKKTCVQINYHEMCIRDRLKAVDEVAYVRFASVYREFKDVDSFMEEIKKILK